MLKSGESLRLCGTMHENRVEKAGTDHRNEKYQKSRKSKTCPNNKCRGSVCNPAGGMLH